MMTVWFRPVLVLGFLLLSSPGWAAPPVPVTTCGQTLRGPATYVLAGDLTCPPLQNLILDSATLLLGGHTLTCVRTIGCLTLRGHGAQVREGTIAANEHYALVLEGDGGHTIVGVVATVIDHAVLLTSNDNVLRHVTAASRLNPAFDVQGHANRLTHSTALCPEILDACVSVQGHDNRLEDLEVTVVDAHRSSVPGSTGAAAVEMRGNNNTLRLSSIVNADGVGLLVRGLRNTLIANRLSGFLDALDASAGCTNTWRRNIFLTQTARVPCLLPLLGPDPDDDADEAALN